MNFSDLNIHSDILDAISYMGFKNTTPIQEQAVPVILEGKDLIACAQTGTGKTAAYIIPVLNMILNHHESTTSTLILVPTRELALQIDQQVQGIGYNLGIHSIAIYGGSGGEDWGQQKRALTSGADIVVATPGKLIAHLNLGYVKFDAIRYLVLDEADRMLDIGFYDDIMKIISFIPAKRQTLMFSATMATNIRSLASKILSSPAEINIAMSKPAEGVLQAVYLCYDNQKIPLINNLIANKEDYSTILIFCSTRKKVSELTKSLQKSNIAESISSDLEQVERESVLQRFKAGQTRILVATDILSRGIDIKGIELIINYDVPGDAEDYVHRVGRTARADATGVALTLVNEKEMGKFLNIEKLIKMEIIKLKVPDVLGKSPEWKVVKSKKKGHLQQRSKKKDVKSEDRNIKKRELQ
ncbi:MAG: DEAD/DEAH box helicase [Bacteroidales bacterium]|nr:DEAD/DEAH box helicase [Bacteroidales bacterium]